TTGFAIIIISMSVSASHLYYTCPEGAMQTLVCNQRGGASHPNDSLWRLLVFSHPTKTSTATNHTGELLGQLQNVTHADQGRYCCAALEIESIHHEAVQRTHSHMFLNIIPSPLVAGEFSLYQLCLCFAPPGHGASGLGHGGLYFGFLLSRLLFCLLVYRQRQSAQSRSEAHGHENPVFLGGSPQIKNRTVSQIMARQSSETGRHLLSEPGTPLSPPATWGCFLPSRR
uniref:V-set immunoregulatory receptor n=1 Tax=Takifugu rubripes TaxID=31033 RepID=A0A674NEA6_TAKRU